jgi:CMP/dCMP kinase
VNAGRPPPRVVAIDGPAGVGKSTAARGLARELGLPFLDTGAMYRAVALEVRARKVDPEDRDGVAELVGSVPLTVELLADGSAAEVTLRGEPVTAAARRQAVGELASRLAAHPEVRRRLVALQRQFAREHGAVLEGRDIGTVVFPETPFKFFLDASPEVRAHRRAEQLRAAGEEVDEVVLAAELRDRDARDRDRQDSPLRADASYVVIDTSGLDADQVVALMARQVRARED